MVAERGVSDYSEFKERLRGLIDLTHFDGAVELATRYWAEPFTGRFFHALADDEHPDEITARDIVAVSTLSVDIPPRVAIWLLGEGRAVITELLSRVPTDVDIWDAGDLLGPDQPLWELWRVLSSASWPEPNPSNDMGRTKISKVLAAKRARLVPVFDSVVEGLFPKLDNYWTAFQEALADQELRLLLSIASSGGAPEGAGLLRRLDAMLWMIGRDQAR